MNVSDQPRPAQGGLAELLRLAGPVVLSRLGIMAMGLTDAIVVGRYSATELGYHALGWAPTSTVLTTAIGLLIGVQVLTARLIGSGQPERSGAVLTRGVGYAVVIGVASMLALALGGPWAMRHIGLDPDLAEGAGRALHVFSLSLPFYLAATSIIFFLEAHGRAPVATAAMWAANAVNLALNLWLVPGDSGLPVQGAVASGWATFGARTALLVFLVAYLARWSRARELGLWARPPREPGAAAEQRRIGYAAGSSYFIETAAFASMSIIAGWLGAAEVAAWAIVLNVAAIVFMIPLGLAAATSVLVGRSYGARDPAGIARAFRLGSMVTAAVLLLVGLVVWIDAGLIARAYTTEAGIVAMTGAALLLSCWFFVADGLQVVAAQALRARGDVWWPTALHIVAYALVMIPLAYLLAIPAGLGLNGIVWAVIAASLIAAVTLVGRFLGLQRADARRG